jgi:methionyl-tRNA synthetase
MRIPLLSRTFPVAQSKRWISRNSRTSLRDPSRGSTVVNGTETVRGNLCSNCSKKYSTTRVEDEEDKSPETFVEKLKSAKTTEHTEIPSPREEIKKKDRQPGRPYFVTTPIFYVNGGNRL